MSSVSKQADNEQLLDYIKRFKQLRDVLKTYLGTDILYKFCENQQDYKALGTDTAKQKKYKEESIEAWMAYLVIRGSDQSKYGTLTKKFVTDYSLGTDQYPRTM